MKISLRLLCTAAFVIVIYGATWLAAAGSRAGKVELPEKDLGAVPARLGSWLGENVAADPNLFAKSGSEAHLTRVYRDSGREITTTIEVFVDYVPDRGLEIHSPYSCYPAAGYRIVGEQDLDLSSESGLKCSARMLTVERGRSRLFVVFWYQLGDRSFTTKEKMRAMLWSLRGQDSWPFLMKVMLQTPAPDVQSARQAFREIASPLLTSLEEYRSNNP